jgi:hypothetical protein
VKVRIGDIGPMPRERAAVEYVPWRLVQPVDRESCRWQHSDGRWVALTLGHDDEIGRVVVTDSGGRRELVDAYETALALARHWRT